MTSTAPLHLSPEEIELAIAEPFDLDACQDKDVLEAYARVRFGREIDKRKRLETLKAEVRSLIDGTTQRVEAEEAAAEHRATNPGTPKTVRHKGNGFTFPWNPLYAKNADLEVIEWED
jgi:hypothetical protein